MKIWYQSTYITIMLNMLSLSYYIVVKPNYIFKGELPVTNYIINNIICLKRNCMWYKPTQCVIWTFFE